MIFANFGMKTGSRYTGAGRQYETLTDAMDAMCAEYGEPRRPANDFDDILVVKRAIEARSAADIVIYEA